MLLNRCFPLSDMSLTLKEIDRVFEAFHSPLTLQSVTRNAFPAINLYEKDDQATLIAELPGIDPEKLEITVLDDTVTLSGERTVEPVEGERYVRQECPNGSFSRTMTLPNSVDPESIQAEYKHGVLKVTMNKAQVKQPRRIAIQS